MQVYEQGSHHYIMLGLNVWFSYHLVDLSTVVGLHCIMQVPLPFSFWAFKLSVFNLLTKRQCYGSDLLIQDLPWHSTQYSEHLKFIVTFRMKDLVYASCARKVQHCTSLSNDHMIGMSMSEPHTCELNAGFDIFLVHCMLFHMLLVL